MLNEVSLCPPPRLPPQLPRAVCAMPSTSRAELLHLVQAYRVVDTPRWSHAPSTLPSIGRDGRPAVTNDGPALSPRSAARPSVSHFGSLTRRLFYPCQTRVARLPSAAAPAKHRPREGSRGSRERGEAGGPRRPWILGPPCRPPLHNNLASWSGFPPRTEPCGTHM